MDRRTFGALTSQAMLAALMQEVGAAREAAQASPDAAMTQAMAKHAALLAGPKLTIALMPYPGMFLQDLVGPLTMFEALLNRDVLLVWKDKNPIAEAVQLYVEYDPQPPFDAGSPTTAPPAAKAFIDDMFGPVVGVARQTAERARKRLGA